MSDVRQLNDTHVERYAPSCGTVLIKVAQDLPKARSNQIKQSESIWLMTVLYLYACEILLSLNNYNSGNLH